MKHLPSLVTMAVMGLMAAACAYDPAPVALSIDFKLWPARPRPRRRADVDARGNRPYVPWLDAATQVLQPDAPQALAIRFVAVEGDALSGELEPYRDRLSLAGGGLKHERPVPRHCTAG